MGVVDKVASEFRRALWLLGAFSFFANLLLLTQPIFMLQIYDRVLPSRSLDTLIYISLLALAMLILLGLTEVVRSIIAHRAATRMDVALGENALRQVIGTGSTTGGNTQPLRDVSALRGVMSSKMLFGALDLPFSWIFIGLLWFIHPALFWLTVGGALALVVVAVLNQRAVAAPMRRQSEGAMRSAARSDHLARSADSIVAMGMTDNVVGAWGRTHADELIAADEAARVGAWFSGFSRTLRIVLQVATLGVGGYFVLKGEMTAGMIFAASMLSGRGLQPIDQIIGTWPQLVGGWSAWRRVRAFLKQNEAAKRRTTLPRPEGRLTVEGATVVNAFDPARPPILANVSFDLPAGKALAVIGNSGSGKSTLARLLVGASEPRVGTVRLDGHELRNWNREELGAHVGYLSQDVELIPGTVRENIARFDRNARDEDVVEAARLAHAEELIATLPRGYDTAIGPGGVQVSGGEKQRIGLARAFYGDPRLIVLDEPNSNLDGPGETALMRAMLEARRKAITVVIVTQRARVLEIVDRVLRMKDGRVDVLLPRDEFVAKQIEAQRAEEAARQAAAQGMSQGMGQGAGQGAAQGGQVVPSNFAAARAQGGNVSALPAANAGTAAAAEPPAAGAARIGASFGNTMRINMKPGDPS